MANVPWCHDCNEPDALCKCGPSPEASRPTRNAEVGVASDTCEQAASDALDFVMRKLPAIKKEKGLVGVWMNAWRLAWDSGRSALAITEPEREPVAQKPFLYAARFVATGEPWLDEDCVSVDADYIADRIEDDNGVLELVALFASPPAQEAVTDGWRTMDSAPKDGTWFLGYRPSPSVQDTIEVWHWDATADTDGAPGFWVNAADSNLDAYPTLWRSLDTLIEALHPSSKRG